MINPRALLIESCFQCPHVREFHSHGVGCELAKKKIVEGNGDRRPFTASTPDWCPLPRVTTATFTDTQVPNPIQSPST